MNSASSTNSFSINATSTNLYASNLTLGSPLSIANGGTGSTTLGGLLTGNGTGALTAASITGPLTFSGNTLAINQAALSQSGYLSSTDFTTFNNKISSSSLSATAPLAYNASTGAFSITQAGASSNGYLSSTDWTNFNAKLGSSTIASLTPNYDTYWNGSSFANGAIYDTGTNIGIGTTSSSALLTVDSTSTTGTLLRLSNGNTGGHVYDLISTGSANTSGAGRLDFFDKTAGAARLSIAANGNIGIGTTSPAGLVALSTSNSFTPAFVTNQSEVGTPVADFLGVHWASNYINIQDQTAAASDPAHTAIGLVVNKTVGGTGTTGNHIGIEGRLVVSTAPTTAGNYVPLWGFGIGTVNVGGMSGTPAGLIYGSNPQVLLQNGATFWTAAVGEEVDNEIDSGASAATKVGINITTVGSDAVQGSNTDAALLIGATGVSPGWRDGILFSKYNNGNPVSATGTLLAATGGFTVLHGIDLSQITCSSDCFKSTGFAVTSSGIVNGANLYASSTPFLTFEGVGAGQGIIANATSTDPTSGVRSSAFGYQALSAATSSPDNTAVGYQALLGIGSNISPIGENTAVGSLALRNITTGNIDAALGYQALKSNSSGGSNSALGGFALGNLTTGSGNVAIGRDALIQNVTGGNNVAIGFEALRGLAGTNSNDIGIGANVASSSTSGSNNIAIGYDIALPVANGSNQLDIGNLIFGMGLNGEGPTVSGGDVGVGTSTSYARLTLWGQDAASSTAAFAVVNSASTTVFAVFDGGNAQLSGTLTQSSDQRLKTNVTSLDASTSLAAVNALTPVTYNWLDPSKGTTRQYGFIAQQVQQVFPELVSTTSATALTPNGTLGLNYLGLIAPIVGAVQTLSSEIASLETTITGFAQSFASKQITATQQLCVDKSDGSPVCVTGDQLAGILSGTPSVQISAPTPPTISGTTTPPSIDIQGSNPATIDVGSTYTDLGAIVNDNQGNSLGYKIFLNGTLVSNIIIDTTQVATDTIDYVATDTWGNTSTSTRTVMIEAAPSSRSGQ